MLKNKKIINVAVPIMKYHDIKIRKIQDTSSKGYMHPHIYISIIYSSQIMEEAHISIH